VAQGVADPPKNINALRPVYETQHSFVLSCDKQWFVYKSYHTVPPRDSISQPIAPISSMAGGADTTLYVDHAARAQQAMFAA
jgi:hypothetical protein